MLTPLASLRTGLELCLSAESRAWLHRALAEAADAHTGTSGHGAHTGTSGHGAHTDTGGHGAHTDTGVHGAPTGTSGSTGTAAQADPAPDPSRPGAAPGLPRWELHFVTAGRKCHPAPRDSAATATVPDPVDAARVLILHAAAPDTGTLARLYTRGTADERRAVLLALPHLDPPPDTAGALALVEDALRANDTRLIAAALGPYAAAHLDAHQWRQGVLKCLFTGVPLAVVAGLEHRAAGDDELVRMLEDYARERTAAGRTVPEDLGHLLELARFTKTEEREAR
ncbi:EboA domain-containing protein [Streptomyces spirodelae]|uniref:EboA domain-containing protein n=1 Tax=Streptomyces spirodelae TaxID=2812904 RepID=A0ABS3WVB9_9ACTN|nr:EboA domain-containing protein [Streptomyces spirodelae]MBO8187078.1 EboA domain-containing protein [Streptomyces spirodelae]